MFYGPPGVGKTTAALAFCRSIFGADYGKRVLELNASDERGIQVVRDKVKRFAQQVVSTKATGGGVGAGSKLLAVKVIILDEADQMTIDAQSALRRIMEQHLKTTRFIILCNYVTKIIDPLHSRCMKFEFGPLPPADQRKLIDRICECESIDMSEGKARQALFTLTGGDLRKSVTLLQMAHSMASIKNETVAAKPVVKKEEADGDIKMEDGKENKPKQMYKITEEDLFRLSSRMPVTVILKLVECLIDESDDAILNLLEFVKMEILLQGYSVQKVLKDVYDYVNDRGSFATRLIEKMEHVSYSYY